MNETEKDKEVRDVKDVKAFISVKVQKLTAALYLVSDFLSNQDPLKWKLRDKALEVLSQANEAGIFDGAVNSIGQLILLIEVSLAAPGVSQMNFSLLKKEYEGVRNKMLGLDLMPEDLADSILIPAKTAPTYSHPQVGASAQIKPVLKTTTNNVSLPKSVNNPRRETILGFVKSHGWSSIKEIAQIMPQVSAKTVQRELADLVQSGALKREGDRRWSRYHFA